MIIGISGKKQSGKDTVCKIIQYLIFHSKAQDKIGWTYQQFLDTFHSLPNTFPPNYDEISGYQRKLFADKLKDIVCLLIGCTRNQLEDNNFKEKELGEEWHVLITRQGMASLEEPLHNIAEERKLTPHLLLQLIGTECGRNIIHPNIWVNAIMSDYKENIMVGTTNEDKSIYKFPNWIITDTRFPNEVKAIEDRGGVVIRVENNRLITTDNHPSETSLDNYQFKFIINNDGTIGELILKVKNVLEKLKII